MNSKVFGTINAASWARGDEIGNQFNVLNVISNPNLRSSIVDVCQLCKNPGDVQLSPDSDIYVSEGCRCSAGQAPESTTSGAVVDVAEVATVPTQEPEPVNEGDYVESSPVVDAVANGGSENKYISENNTVAPSDLTPPEPTEPAKTAEQTTDEQVKPAEPATDEPIAQVSNEPATDKKVEIIGKDEGAVEKFYTGQMTPLEYSINITIIILFIAISVMAIMMIFKMAYCKCLGCGAKCSHVCPRCGKCEDCCRCHEQYQPVAQPVAQPAPEGSIKPVQLNGGYFSRKSSPSAVSSNAFKPTTPAVSTNTFKPVSLSGSIF